MLVLPQGSLFCRTATGEQYGQRKAGPEKIRTARTLTRKRDRENEAGRREKNEKKRKGVKRRKEKREGYNEIGLKCRWF